MKKLLFFFIIILGVIGSYSLAQDNFSTQSSLLPVFHNYSEILFEAHIDIGEHYQDFGDMGKVVDVIKDLKSSNAVEVSSYGWLTKEGYNRATNLLNDTKKVKKMLEQKINNFKAKELKCWEKKKYYDKRFFNALEYLGVSSMEKSMNFAIEYEWCATEARVHYNAYKELYDKLMYEENIYFGRYQYRKTRRSGLIQK